MMHSPLNQNHRLLCRANPLLCVLRQRRHRPPGVGFTADDGQAVVGDVVPTVFVDGVDVGWGGDAEGVFADEGFVGEVEEAGDEGELVFGDAGAGLEVAPLGAVLVGPGAPGLGEVVLGVEGGVVVAEALILGLAG